MTLIRSNDHFPPMVATQFFCPRWNDVWYSTIGVIVFIRHSQRSKWRRIHRGRHDDIISWKSLCLIRQAKDAVFTFRQADEANAS